MACGRAGLSGTPMGGHERGVQAARASLRRSISDMEQPMSRLILLCVGLLAAATASAANPKPEILRQATLPQPVGALHTVRTIPEACARLEG
jgi:hypothetical protein